MIYLLKVDLDKLGIWDTHRGCIDTPYIKVSPSTQQLVKISDKPQHSATFFAIFWKPWLKERPFLTPHRTTIGKLIKKSRYWVVLNSTRTERMFLDVMLPQKLFELVLKYKTPHYLLKEEGAFIPEMFSPDGLNRVKGSLDVNFKPKLAKSMEKSLVLHPFLPSGSLTPLKR